MKLNTVYDVSTCLDQALSKTCSMSKRRIQFQTSLQTKLILIIGAMNNIFHIVWFAMHYPGRECEGSHMDVSLLPIKISSSPPEPRHQNQKLRWDHQVCTIISLTFPCQCQFS